jgi:hypothetical protein
VYHTCLLTMSAALLNKVIPIFSFS